MLKGKRIFTAVLMQESNAFSPLLTGYDDFKISRGSAMLERLPVTAIFRDAGCDVIPSLMAYAVPGGRLRQEAYQALADEIIAALAQAGPVDGVWLYLHGALEVAGIGSGEAALLQAVRRTIGWSVPVAVALDLHANNTPDLVMAAQILVGYKTAPHVDAEETQATAARLLLRCLDEQVLPRPVMIRIPMLITGERATTGVEPMRSLIDRLRQIEQMPGIWSASYFVGMAWVDTCWSGASVILTAGPGHEELASELALDLAERAWSQRNAFVFEEEAMPPESALSAAWSAVGNGFHPVFITDAGDNVTAGAAGDSASLLQMVLEQNSGGVLLAGLVDGPLVERCRSLPAGQVLETDLGGTLDPLSVRTAVRAVLLWQGRVLDSSGERQTEAVLLRCKGTADDLPGRSIDLIVTRIRCAFTAPLIIESAPVRLADYSLVIVKQGYLFDALRKVARYSVMALTAGNGSQDLSTFTYTQVTRPVYPIDAEIEWQPGRQDLIMRSLTAVQS